MKLKKLFYDAHIMNIIFFHFERISITIIRHVMHVAEPVLPPLCWERTWPWYKTQVTTFDPCTVRNFFTTIWRLGIEIMMCVKIKSTCNQNLIFQFFLLHNFGKDLQYADNYRLYSCHLSWNYGPMCMVIRHIEELQANFMNAYINPPSQTSLVWKIWLLTVHG